MLKTKVLILYIIIFWLIFYLPNLSKSAFGGDSSELVAAMTTWGIAHPPGYPLLMLVGNTFIRIFPFLNIYSRLSLTSAIFTLLTSIIIFLLLKQLFKNLLVSLFCALFYLTLFPIWLYGIVPEVFALANFLIISQIYLLINKKSLLLFFLLIGLSVAHHHLFIFFIPSYLYLIQKDKSLTILFSKNKIKSILSVILGASIYIYAPIVSLFGAEIDIENAKNLEGFLRLITRASYGTFKAYVGSGGDFLNRILDSSSIFIFIVHDFKPLGIIFIILGIIYFLQKRQKTLLNFFLINIVALIFFYFYTNFFLASSFGLATYERFLTFIYLPLIILFGGGITFMALSTDQIVTQYSNKPLICWLTRVVLVIIIINLISTTITSNGAVLVALNKNKYFNNLGKDILETLPENSLLISQSDHSYFLTEHQQILNKLRGDVTLVPLIVEREYIGERIKKKNPRIFIPPRQEKYMKVFLQKNYQQGVYTFSDKPMEIGFWAPYGIVWKYYPNFESFKLESEFIIKTNINLWRRYTLPKISKIEKNILFLNEVRSQYGRQYWSYVNFLAVLDKPLLARQEADAHLKEMQDELKYLIAYINLKVILSECDVKTASLVQKVTKGEIYESTDYLPLLNYYKYCQKDNKTYNELYSKYLKLRKIEEIPLEKI